ncbi:hypothetical protein [Nonomuraea sp. NPDC052265]|uniref:hypothetical protein n=1 Tax=Nonomuraea sp. NPDC052265 TaxID=3364374 RepID=UPI0037C526DF
MDEHHQSIPDVLRPVRDAAAALGADFTDLGAALRALRQVEVEVELATDLLMRQSNARANQARSERKDPAS